MNVLKNKLIPASVLALTLLSTAGASEAKSEPVTSQLRIAATLEGKPALKIATWHIRCHNNSRRYGTTINRHAAVVDLEPGNCTVKVTLDGKSRTRHISIEKDKKHSLIVSLD